MHFSLYNMHIMYIYILLHNNMYFVLLLIEWGNLMWWFSIACILSDLKVMLWYFCVLRAGLFSHSLAGGGSICFCVFMSGYCNGYSCLLIILPWMHDYHKHFLVHAFLPCANSIYDWRWWYLLLCLYVLIIYIVTSIVTSLYCFVYYNLKM